MDKQMDKQFAGTAYEVHNSLFQHYSNQIFRTRVSIVTVIVLSFGYLLGVAPSGEQPPEPLTTALLSYLSAFLVPLLFRVETAYYRRLTQVATAGREIEEAQSVRLYFRLLDQASHWQLYGIYLLGIVAFVALSVWKLSEAQLWPKGKTLLGCLLILGVALPPLALYSSAYRAYRQTASERLQPPSASPEKRRSKKSV